MEQIYDPRASQLITLAQAASIADTTYLAMNRAAKRNDLWTIRVGKTHLTTSAKVREYLRQRHNKES